MSDLMRLARRLSDLEDQLHAATTAPQLAHSSIPDGALDQTVTVPTEEVDPDGNIIYRTEVAARFGMQEDGSNTVVSFAGPIPPRPVGHTVTASPGALAVEWFGEFEGRIEPYLDHDYVAVHVGAFSGFQPIADTLKGTIRARQGESLSVPLPAGTYFVSLVAVSVAGRWSAPSPYAQGEPVDVLERLSEVEALAAAAEQAAIEAQADATTALTAANGINQLHYATTPPGSSDGLDGDTWYQRQAGTDLIVAVFEKAEGAWAERKLTSSVIDSLDAGKITTGTLQAGTTVTTGPTDGTHTVLGESALQVWRPDPDGVPQATATFGGASADEVRFVDPVTGLERASISSSGVVSAETVDADQLLTQGESVRALIAALPRGLVKAHRMTSDRVIQYTSALGEYGVTRIIADVEPGRSYRVTLRGMVGLANIGASTSRNMETRLRYTTDGSTPLITSPLIPDGVRRWYFLLEGQLLPIHMEAIIRIPAGDSTLQVASTIKVNTAGTTFTAKSEHGFPWVMTIEDVGVAWDGLYDDGAITAAGGASGGTGDTPPDTTTPVTRTVQYGINASRSWKGSSISDNNGYLRHGVYGSAQRSMLSFSSQMLSDMQGATISAIRVRLKAEHWYSNGGGATNVGVHGYSALPSSFSRISAYGSTIPTWTSKTGVQWFSLPSSWFGGVNGSSGLGTIRGLTFGDGDSGISNYGYFNGTPSSGADVKPLVEVTFTK